MPPQGGSPLTPSVRGGGSTPPCPCCSAAATWRGRICRLLSFPIMHTGGHA
jgi:hypothetical protein